MVNEFFYRLGSDTEEFTATRRVGLTLFLNTSSTSGKARAELVWRFLVAF